MNNEESKEAFSQYPTNQMGEIESPNVDKTKEKRDNKKGFADKESTYLGRGDLETP
ncbi:hypothetical protein ACIQ4Z_05070 [Peribacillus asahii]|uniref:hypothetical protein n=1 Tax=Peribacillus asahii TaxID=228899 RepID=UPI00382F949D